MTYQGDISGMSRQYPAFSDPKPIRLFSPHGLSVKHIRDPLYNHIPRAFLLVWAKETDPGTSSDIRIQYPNRRFPEILSFSDPDIHIHHPYYQA